TTDKIYFGSGTRLTVL
ncbi:rCG64538, partial [Rattus norvegicus]